MNRPKLLVKDVNLWYGNFQALKNINLNLQENEITAFIGPSGCGKSTMLKCLNRMNDLVEDCRIEGDMLLDGEDIYASNYDVNLLRKRVGMVFQSPNPFPMSIFDNIAYGPRVNIRAAVSPTQRPMARITPDKMPGMATGNTTRTMVRNLPAPRASDPLRKLL